MRPSILLAIVLTILAAAAPASAGTVCQVGGVATFAAGDVGAECPGGANGASEVNSLSVSTDSSGDIVFTDTQPISDGDGPGGCTASGTTGTCPGALTYVFDLGAGDDSASIGAVASGGGTSTGGDGADTLTGGPLADTLDGGPGNDTLSGGGGDDSLSGGAGSDALVGSDGADTIRGGAGDDSLAGGTGDDSLHGDAGNDSLAGADGRDQLFGGDGNDSESGGADGDQLDGGSAFGCVEAGGNDSLNGDAGDDALCGGSGPAAASDNDSLNGGPDEDTAYYVRAASVTISLDDAANDGQAAESDNVHSDIEDVTSGPGADTLLGSAIHNVLDGGPGPDVLRGGAGDDVLTDSGGDNAGDLLDGGPGDDTMSAGRGPDTYSGGDGEDSVVDYAGRWAPVSVSLDNQANDGAGGEADNVQGDVEDVTGGSGPDTLVGNDADNELVGGAGDDSISGGGGNDGLSGGAGRDAIDGGSGRDDLVGGSGADTFNSRDGLTDRVECGGGTDSVQSEQRDDVAGDCENVKVAAPTAVVIRKVQATRAGYVVVTVNCPAVEQQCVGVIIVKTVRRLSRRFVKLGQINYKLRGGLTKVFKAQIKKADRKTLRRARRVKVRTVVTNANALTGDSTNATALTILKTRAL